MIAVGLSTLFAAGSASAAIIPTNPSATTLITWQNPSSCGGGFQTSDFDCAQQTFGAFGASAIKIADNGAFFHGHSGPVTATLALLLDGIWKQVAQVTSYNSDVSALNASFAPAMVSGIRFDSAAYQHQTYHHAGHMQFTFTNAAVGAVPAPGVVALLGIGALALTGTLRKRSV